MSVLQGTVYSDIPQEIFDLYKKYLPTNLAKKGQHYYDEIERVKKGIIAWNKSDIYTFGKLMFASGDSSISLYQSSSEQLSEFHELLKYVEGVYGGKISGAGFKSCYVAFIDKKRKIEIIENILKIYNSLYLENNIKYYIVKE